MRKFKTLDIQATLLGKHYYGWNTEIDKLDGTDNRLVNITKSARQYKVLTMNNDAKLLGELKDDNDETLMSFSKTKDHRVNIYINPSVDVGLL